ncbi:MAG: copper transporter, partial [Acidimicrobiales bacterium]|nr:copper transporter [Acidimicrobiales bacterium]
MINIRYHIVSITAVFLALGIGVALGSTFLDGATVDVLNKNISSAETRIRASNDKIGALEDDLDAARQRDAGLILLGTDRLLGEQLTDQPVLVVAEPGVGDDQLAALLSVLDRSGADLRGTLALRDRLTLTDGDDALAEAIGLESDASAAELRSAVNAQLVDALAAAG